MQYITSYIRRQQLTDETYPTFQSSMVSESPGWMVLLEKKSYRISKRYFLKYLLLGTLLTIFRWAGIQGGALHFPSKTGFCLSFLRVKVESLCWFEAADWPRFSMKKRCRLLIGRKYQVRQGKEARLVLRAWCSDDSDEKTEAACIFELPNTGFIHISAEPWQSWQMCLKVGTM